MKDTEIYGILEKEQNDLINKLNQSGIDAKLIKGLIQINGNITLFLVAQFRIDIANSIVEGRSCQLRCGKRQKTIGLYSPSLISEIQKFTLIN